MTHHLRSSLRKNEIRVIRSNTNWFFLEFEVKKQTSIYKTLNKETKMVTYPCCKRICYISYKYYREFDKNS